jgi:mannose-6-phosphate isomerase-like protein (cupin superfamily)
MKVDKWIWGKEQILRGDDPSHEFTLKILEPEKGRMGCLSLQYHDKKSELWIVFKGLAWALVVVDGVVCTRVMREGDFQVLNQGVLHRLMAVTNDLKVIEPSTVDEHARDKSYPKDVIRLHCVHGREISLPRSEKESELVRESSRVTEEAILAVEASEIPPEYNVDLLYRKGLAGNILSGSL